MQVHGHTHLQGTALLCSTVTLRPTKSTLCACRKVQRHHFNQVTWGCCCILTACVTLALFNLGFCDMNITAYRFGDNSILVLALSVRIRLPCGLCILQFRVETAGEVGCERGFASNRLYIYFTRQR